MTETGSERSPRGAVPFSGAWHRAEKPQKKYIAKISLPVVYCISITGEICGRIKKNQGDAEFFFLYS